VGNINEYTLRGEVRGGPRVQYLQTSAGNSHATEQGKVATWEEKTFNAMAVLSRHWDLSPGEGEKELGDWAVQIRKDFFLHCIG